MGASRAWVALETAAFCSSPKGTMPWAAESWSVYESRAAWLLPGKALGRGDLQASAPHLG